MITIEDDALLKVLKRWCEVGEEGECSWAFVGTSCDESSCPIIREIKEEEH